MDVSVSYNDPVWILVTPTSSSAYVNVTATPSVSYSSSSYSSSDDSTLVAILVPTIVGGFFFIIFIVFIIVWNIIRRKRLLEAQNNAMAAMVRTSAPAPQPQLYYPPNYTPNYTQASQVQSVMHPMPPMQPSYISPPPVHQEIIVIEPIPTYQNQVPTHTKVNSQPIQPVYPDGAQPVYPSGEPPQSYEYQ